MKILITGGATREPIDEVRFITNFSSGRTAMELAKNWSNRGHQVTLFMGQGGLLNETGSQEVDCRSFADFQDLNRKLVSILDQQSFDLIVHAAAVSDYSVDRVLASGVEMNVNALKKIDSGEDLVVHLKRNFKIVERLKDYSRNPHTRVVAFKLTNSESQSEREAAVLKLGMNTGVDMVVHNDFSEMKVGDQRVFRVYKKQNVIWKGRELNSLADFLLKEVEREAPLSLWNERTV